MLIVLGRRTSDMALCQEMINTSFSSLELCPSFHKVISLADHSKFSTSILFAAHKFLVPVKHGAAINLNYEHIISRIGS